MSGDREGQSFRRAAELAVGAPEFDAEREAEDDAALLALLGEWAEILDEREQIGRALDALPVGLLERAAAGAPPATEAELVVDVALERLCVLEDAERAFLLEHRNEGDGGAAVTRLLLRLAAEDRERGELDDDEL
jgi:hypothetical protein